MNASTTLRLERMNDFEPRTSGISFEKPAYRNWLLNMFTFNMSHFSQYSMILSMIFLTIRTLPHNLISVISIIVLVIVRSEKIWPIGGSRKEWQMGSCDDACKSSVDDIADRSLAQRGLNLSGKGGSQDAGDMRVQEIGP